MLKTAIDDAMPTAVSLGAGLYLESDDIGRWQLVSEGADDAEVLVDADPCSGEPRLCGRDLTADERDAAVAARWRLGRACDLVSDFLDGRYVRDAARGGAR